MAQFGGFHVFAGCHEPAFVLVAWIVGFASCDDLTSMMDVKSPFLTIDSMGFSVRDLM